MKSAAQPELPISPEPATRPARGFHSIRLFTDHTFAARFWLAAFLLSHFLQLVHSLVPHPREFFSMIGEDGTTIRSPLMRFRDAHGVHVQQARQAAAAFLNRTPTAFENEDLLETMFLSDAFKKARAQFGSEAAERAAKQLHQSAEIASVEVLKVSDRELLVQVTGQLVRAGMFQNRMFSGTKAFKLSLRMLRNPDPSQNSRFPTAVADFHYETIP